MRAGALDRTIIIERAAYSVNEYGTEVAAWSTVATLRAERIANEALPRTEGAPSTDRTATFRMRFLAGLTFNDRMLFEGAPWTIRDIQEIGRRRGLEIKVERIGS